jgi:hypothetical protein
MAKKLAKKATKKMAKPARAEQEAARVSVQQAKDKADDASVKEYTEKYDAYKVMAHPVLAAKELIELAGGYGEAFVLMDAVYFVSEFKPKAGVREEKAKPDDSGETDSADEYEASAALARKVLTAAKLVELAGGYYAAFTLLDAVMIEMEGPQGHEQAAEVRRSAAGHHEILAAAAKEEEGKRID